MRGLCLCLCLTALGCGPEMPAHAPRAEVAPPHAEVPAPAAEPPAPGEPRAPFRLAWSLQAPPFNKGVALAPGGQVALLGSRLLSLYDRASGSKLADKEVCFTFEGAFAFIDDKTGALVCDDGVQLFELPDLSQRAGRALSGKATLAAFGPGLLALAFGSGPVRVIDTASWEDKGAFEVGEEVTALAIAPDGRWLAIGSESGELAIHPLAEGEARRLSVRRGLEVDAVAFSPRGDRLLASGGPLVALWRIDGELERRFHAVGSVLAARWLGDEEIAVIGPDGLLLLDAGGGLGSVDGSGLLGPPVALAIAADGRALCAAERDGKLACFSRGRLPAARPVPIDLDPGSRFGSLMPGRVLSVQGQRARIEALPRASLPEAGSDVVVLRYLHKNMGTLETSRWVKLAEARVVGVAGKVVSLRIDSQLVPVEGQPPLPRDAPVRLGWAPRDD